MGARALRILCDPPPTHASSSRLCEPQATLPLTVVKLHVAGSSTPCVHTRPAVGASMLTELRSGICAVVRSPAPLLASLQSSGQRQWPQPQHGVAAAISRQLLTGLPHRTTLTTREQPPPVPAAQRPIAAAERPSATSTSGRPLAALTRGCVACVSFRCDVAACCAPCFIICCKNFTMTLEAGRISTWRLPRFSALKMLRRQSFSTEMRTILRQEEQMCSEPGWARTERARAAACLR